MQLRLRKILSPMLRSEETVFNELLIYGTELKLAATLLREMVEAFIAGKKALLETKYKELLERESSADILRREISSKLVKGSFFSNLRELLLELVERMDKIADYCKDASRILFYASSYVSGFKKVLESESFTKFLSSQENCVESLLKIIKSIAAGHKVTIEEIQLVETWEEEADNDKDEVLKTLYSLRDSIDPINFFLLRELTLLIDSVCDAAEDSSDVLLNIISMLYRS
jgi:predicted phosphate transport protein (TIGR00153 family)